VISIAADLAFAGFPLAGTTIIDIVTPCREREGGRSAWQA